ncbi:MAG: single-stranded DNA-binding protein [Christensenellaceae bacterium]
MNNSEKKNNRVFLQGEIVTEKTFSHEMYGERFYEMSIKVLRLSGQADILPITVSERLIDKNNLEIGNSISVVGQFRSYNKFVDGKSKLMLTVFVRDILDVVSDRAPNTIVLVGHICKQPIYRTTPFNREICDVLVAINRAYNKSDYIPCIVWGRNARFVKNLQVGEQIALTGRIQSREYQKKTEDDVKILTAYEVSVAKIAVGEHINYFELDKEFGIEEYEEEAVDLICV